MKVRGDFVTNSSSSSFILAFKNKRDAYAEACIAFMKMKDYERQEDEKYRDEDDDEEYERGFSFDDHACALDNVLLAMEDGKINADEAIKRYLDSVSWYPVRHRIYERMWNDEENYPRESADDFKAKYGEEIERLREEELIKLKQELEEWLKNKKYITYVSFEDHWPEGQANSVCNHINKDNSRKL